MSNMILKTKIILFKMVPFLDFEDMPSISRGFQEKFNQKFN